MMQPDYYGRNAGRFPRGNGARAVVMNQARGAGPHRGPGWPASIGRAAAGMILPVDRPDQQKWPA
jgi:hypothetical protein